MSAIDQHLGDGQGGYHVAGCPPAGDDREGGPPGRRLHERRATLARTPAPNMAMTSDDPPNETNGRGTPVTGSSPTTAPMLITACPTSQAVTPADTRAE